MAFGLSGLASGVDTSSLVEQLMAIERQPQQRMQLNKRVSEARETALRDVMSRLKNLLTAAADLRSAGLWADTQTVDTSDATKVTAKRVSGAGPGGYQIRPTQLARAEQRTYDYVQSGSATQITIGGVTVDIAAGADVNAAASAINSTSGSPVYAVAVAGQLVLSSRQTGAANGFTASGSQVTEDAAKEKLGLDASYRLDGVVKTSASNVITDAIPGVEITLKGVATANVTVTVGPPAADPAAVKAKVKAFVEQYNSTVDFIRSKLNEKRPVNPSTETDAMKGLLQGDTMLSGLLSRLRTTVTEQFAGNPAAYDQMSEIGVSTAAANGSGTLNQDAIAGKLQFDEAKFDAAMAGNPLAVRQLLGAQSGFSGFAQAIEGWLSPATGAGGTMDGRIAQADAEQKRLSDSIANMDRRLEVRQRQLKSYFAAMESAMSAAQQQSQWLAGQLAGLQQGR